MLAELRREQIVSRVNERGQVTTEELARSLAVSVETIRRDLGVLEEASQLSRVHGGAISLLRHVHAEASYAERREQANWQKTQIGRFIAGLLPEDATVFLDLGTTIDAIVESIPDSFCGTLLTTSLRIGMELARLPRAEVLVTGGRLRRDELSVSGSMAAAFLAGFHPDIAVISTGAVSAETGITDYDLEEIQLKRLVLANAGRAYLVADATKIGQTATYQFCSVAEPYAIVTSSDVNGFDRSRLIEAGANVLTVPEGS